jgi:glycosyltransferase involved in cell wall biosynthesis
MTPSGEPDAAPRRVLVVETRAHRPVAHFPTRFAELAVGFAEIGCAVEVLTSDGWLFEGERPVPFVVNRYGRVNRLLDRIGEAFQNTRGFRGIAGALRVRGMVRAVNERCRAAGDPMADVIVVSTGIDPIAAAAIAGRGRWLLYELEAPERVLRRFSARATRAESRRRSVGDCARIATPLVDDTEAWQEIAPFLSPVTLPIAGVRAARQIPDAKQRLGVDRDAKVAVVFGAADSHKDIDLVTRTFADLPNWQLVVAGRVADAFRPPAGGRDAVVIGGFVDLGMRDVVYSAADLVVLSFTPEYQGNSALVTDAIAAGVPVVCSDGSIAAAIVREYRLGVVFVPGDPDALARAVDVAPAHVEPADLERARAELSNRVVAARFLKALPYSVPADGGQP